MKRRKSKYSIKHSFYASKEWKFTRAAVLERDNYTCQDCLQVGRNLPKKAIQVHHIIFLSQNWNLRLKPGNLVSLCGQCHVLRHPELTPKRARSLMKMGQRRKKKKQKRFIRRRK